MDESLQGCIKESKTSVYNRTQGIKMWESLTYVCNKSQISEGVLIAYSSNDGVATLISISLKQPTVNMSSHFPYHFQSYLFRMKFNFK